MNMKDLQDRVYQEGIQMFGDTMTREKAKTLVDTVFTGVKTGLRNDSIVSLHGVGNFTVKDRAAREFRNPQDPGSTVKKPAHKVIAFKPAADWTESVQVKTKKK